MRSFETDLGHEKILASYLDNIYKEKGISFYRVSDLDHQLQGIDLIYTSDGREYYIDEKAQLHYLNADLPTFTFELSYLKDNSYRRGWFFDDDKMTHYYFLVTGIFLNKDLSELKCPGNIQRLKITSVNREKLTAFLTSRNLCATRLLEYEADIRERSSVGKNHIAELDPRTEGLLFFTDHLEERPINIQLRLDFLIRNRVAKRFH